MELQAFFTAEIAEGFRAEVAERALAEFERVSRRSRRKFFALSAVQDFCSLLPTTLLIQPMANVTPLPIKTHHVHGMCVPSHR